MPQQTIGPHQAVTIPDAVQVNITLTAGPTATVTAQQNAHSHQYHLTQTAPANTIHTDEAGPIVVSMGAEFGNPQVLVSW
ncbi:hypothetical protein [Thalassospira marina]|uniref:Uncharacterized protein n=1 Tax=Thalassospira marina TaxID=2048283 RepID=A0A2N3KJ44_9PROT|nr:hypothetical protein [Thalassospira marina]PKR50564.1 hypothetical protein COO20_20705 [Thalassospira marina]